MDERERILQLVREGVLSVDEGLDLLENVANKETEKTERREFTSEPSYDKEKAETKDDKAEKTDDQEKDQEEETAADEKEASAFEEELEGLANQLNQYSVEIDNLNEEITDLKGDLSEVEEDLTERKDNATEDYNQDKDDLQNEISTLHKEIELITAIDGVDNYDEIQSLNKELTSTMEELNQLENTATTDEEIKELEQEAADIRENIEELVAEKDNQLKEMHSLKMKQWTTKAKQVSERIDIPEGWREGASKTIDKAGDIFDETSKTLGDALRQTFKTTKDTIDNIDWKDIDFNFNADKKIQDEFDHEWKFEDTTATILDFKNANGNIQFKTSSNEDIKVNAHIKLYGKMEEATSLDAFEARSIINIDEDKFKFHIPNKNIIANMIIYLPKREYDYLHSNSFNGNVKFDELTARDLYIKTTNGDIIFDHLDATMLEVKGTNGDITLKNTKLRDLLINTVNGDVRIVGNVQSSDINTTNGTFRLSLSGEELIRVTGGSVNGDVKVSFPEKIGLEIEAKSMFGKVKSRLSNTNSSLSKELKGKTHTFNRVGTGEICRVNVSTTTGNVLFKDTDAV